MILSVRRRSSFPRNGVFALKIAITVIVTLLLAGGGVWGWGRYGSRAVQAKVEPTAVRVEVVNQGDLVETVSTPA